MDATKPLDLEQFEREAPIKWAMTEVHRRALLAECKRQRKVLDTCAASTIKDGQVLAHQREQIKTLRDALEEAKKELRLHNLTQDGEQKPNTMIARTLKIARAALAATGD